MADFLNSQMDYLIIFGGLAFIMPVPLCKSLRWKSQSSLAYHWLGFFGPSMGIYHLLYILV